MKHIIKKFYIFIFFLTTAQTSSAKNSFTSWYNSMTDQEKIAQVFITGIQGQNILPSEKRIFNKWPVGGVIYFKRNFKSPSQFKSLHSNLLSQLENKPFTFTDQEGGDVVRIGTPYDTPPSLALGSLNSKKVTQYLGEASGSLLRHLGVSSNLAPVIDIKDVDTADFISNRSYGSDPKLVSNMALAFSKGLIGSGVLPTLKHFPGLGGITTDSHKLTPIKYGNLKKLKKTTWLPYIKIAKSKLPFFVMTSHVKFVLNKKDLGVVTYSSEAVEHLRNITSKNQVVITDDLEMGGAKTTSTFAKSALKSFMAGHDYILIGWPGRKLLAALKLFKKQLKNKLFEERLKTSLQRIYALKQKHKKIVKKSKPFSKEKSLHLTSILNSKISEFFLMKSLLKTSRKPSSSKEFHYFSSDPVFQKHFSRKEISSLLRSNPKFIESICRQKTCLLHLTGYKTAQKINLLLAQSNNKYLILNSLDPNFLNSEISKKHRVINIYTKSYKLGSQVKKALASDNSILKNLFKKIKKVASF